jgi:FkbM family methyltransferase
MKIIKYLKIRYVKILFFKIKNKIIISYFKNKYQQPFLKQTRINDYNIIVFLNDAIGRQIYGLKKYEKENSDFLMKLIKDDWIIFDIGANIGYYTLLFSQLAPQGKIFSFEPNKKIFNLLNLNITLNDFKNVVTSNLALSNFNGYNEFVITQDSGFSSFKDTGRISINNKIQVKTFKLDDYTHEYRIKKIDFIKMDVEGAEGLVIEVAREILENIKPKLMFIEINKKNLQTFNNTAEALIDLIISFGYHPFYLFKDKLAKFTFDKIKEDQNLYFIHENHLSEFRGYIL